MSRDPVIWNQCSAETYSAIYNEFKPYLGVYSVAGNYGGVFMTTWSLGDAPLIKSEGLKVNKDGHQSEDGDVSRKPEDWTYYIATARYLEPKDE